MRTLPLLVALLLSKVNPSSGDAQTCADETIAMNQRDKNALGHKAAKLIKAYNNTCEATNMCEINLDDDTAAYFSSITLEEDNEPSLPDVPMIGSGSANFQPFMNDIVYKGYEELCLEYRGHMKFIDVDLKLKGTAMDLVDVDVKAELRGYPLCLSEKCQQDDDLVEVFEFAVKHAIVANADELTEQQKTLISSMNIELACAASGIEDCSLTASDSDNLRGISGATQSGGAVTAFVAIALGALAIIAA